VLYLALRAEPSAGTGAQGAPVPAIRG